MDLNQKIIAGLLLAFFLITLLRIFRTPLRLALKLSLIHISEPTRPY